ncbi:MAG: efflux RND transporter permease subunit, partial [Pseudomonadota bacterium]
MAALIAVFGAVALSGLPIQLLPNLEEPRIAVENAWRAAAPEEMESGIVEPQEDVLKNIPGLISIETFIARGSGWVNLTFETGTDVQAAKLDVINRLGQTPPLPVDAREPVVFAGAQAFGPGAASLLIRVLPGNPERELANYQALIEEHVEPRLARIPGVSRVNLQGERPRELQIIVDTYRAAALGLALDDITRVVSRAVDVSGGSADVGRRRYTVRFVGQFEPADLNQLVVGIDADRPVYLSEIAEVVVAPRAQDG